MGDIMNRNTAVQSREKRVSDSLPWVEKYRPSTFDEIISQNDIITTSRMPAGFFIARSQAFYRNKQSPALAVLRSARHGKDNDDHGVCEDVVREQPFKHDLRGNAQEIGVRV